MLQIQVMAACGFADTLKYCTGLPIGDVEDPEDEAALVAFWGERMQVCRCTSTLSCKQDHARWCTHICS